MEHFYNDVNGSLSLVRPDKYGGGRSSGLLSNEGEDQMVEKVFPFPLQLSPGDRRGRFTKGSGCCCKHCGASLFRLGSYEEKQSEVEPAKAQYDDVLKMTLSPSFHISVTTVSPG